MKKIVIIVMLIMLVAFCVGCGSTGEYSEESNKIEQSEGSDASKNDIFKPIDDIRLSNKTNYEALVSDYCDPSYGEYITKDLESYNWYSPKEKMTFEINGQKYECSFVEKTYRLLNYYPTYIYKDENRNEFGIGVDGELTHVFLRESRELDIVLSQEQCEQIAEDFMKKFVDTEDYTKTVREKGSEYYIDYQKFIDGVATIDGAYISVSKNGDILSFITVMFGRVPTGIDTSEIDFEKAKKVVFEKLDIFYKDQKTEYEQPEFAITVLKDGSIGLSVSVNVHLIYDYATIGELVGLVVTMSE